MDGQISSMDESVICAAVDVIGGCHPWMKVAFMGGGTSSMDESAISG